MTPVQAVSGPSDLHAQYTTLCDSGGLIVRSGTRELCPNRPCPHRVIGPDPAQHPVPQVDRRPGQACVSMHNIASREDVGIPTTPPISTSLAFGHQDHVGPTILHAWPQGILSCSNEASRKLARHGGKIVAFEDPGILPRRRDVHLTLLKACRRLRRPRPSSLTRARLPQHSGAGDGPRQHPNQWVQGYIMGRPVSSSSTEDRPQQGVFSAGDLDTTAASLLNQYRRVLPAPAPGPPQKKCGLKRRYSAFDIVRQDSEHAIAGAVSVPACIAHALQNAPLLTPRGPSRMSR